MRLVGVSTGSCTRVRVGVDVVRVRSRLWFLRMINIGMTSQWSSITTSKAIDLSSRFYFLPSLPNNGNNRIS